MPCIDLNQINPAELQHNLATCKTLVACLCADWCDVCKAFRPNFEALAEQFPDYLFLWIDIEDQDSLVGDLDIDNFPTILVQHQQIVSFYGTMQADVSQIKRLLQSQSLLDIEQLASEYTMSEQHRQWQTNANIRERIARHV